VGAVAASLAAVPAPQARCAIDDPRLDELSGAVADDGGLWAMSDGGRQVQLHRLGPPPGAQAAGASAPTCAITDTRTADIDPYDAEDLARGPDGSLWVGDTGDNERARDTVAVIVLPVRGEARLHRLTYPDGPHDAEALLVDRDGRPVVVTKEAGRPAGVYRTAEPPDGTGPTPLLRVGELTLPPSETPGGPMGGLGSRIVTGAAASADGRVVALRSYTDAWLYPVPDGDLVAALTGAPVQVPLPGEPQGEAIAFESDGTLLSASETRRGVRGEIRAVPGAVALAADRGPAQADTAPPPVPIDAPAPEWMPAAIGGGAAVGVLLLLAAALAVRRR
jgi:hypothetical protein